VTIEPKVSLHQPRQINHLAPDGILAKDRFNWKEMAQFVGGVAIVALLQVGLLFPDTRDFIGSWVVMTLFGVIYAVIGGVTTHVREAAPLVDEGVTTPSEITARA